MSERDTMPDYDALVTRAGVTGIYPVYLLDQAEMSVPGVDTAEDVANWCTQLGDSEPNNAAEEAWTETIYKEFARTLMAGTNAWWIKTSIKTDGTVVRSTRVYVGGGPEYRKRYAYVAYARYEGFELA